MIDSQTFPNKQIVNELYNKTSIDGEEKLTNGVLCIDYSLELLIFVRRSQLCVNIYMNISFLQN